jgi:hypothetical protein
MMCKPLTESLGEELLMLYLGDFHAKTSLLPEQEEELLEAEVQCGNTWRELLAKYNPDTALWKTAQCSLLEDLEQSLEIWPRWGSMQNGECFRQPMLVQITLEKECGLWPTPMAREGNGSQQFKLTDAVEATIGKAMPAMQKNPHLWQKFQSFPTPQASDCRDRGNMSNLSIQRRAELKKQLNLSMVVHPTSGKLNPTWVEWLMGWPLEWTDLKPLVTDKSHYVQQPLGDS